MVIKFGVMVVLMLLSLVVISCGSADKKSSSGSANTRYGEQVKRAISIGDQPLPENPDYNCFYEAYQAIGERMLPQPLPATPGEYGEAVYQLDLSDGSNIPVHVYDLGGVSYAPGEALAETLEAAGMTGEQFFSDASFTRLRQIDIWVFNNSTHITADEAIALSRAYQVTYPKKVDGETVEASMLAQIHGIGGMTEADITVNYNEFKDRQYRHADEIHQSLVAALETGRDRALAAGGFCGEYAAAIWQKKIDQLDQLYAAGEIQIPWQGSMQRIVRPEWEPGEWGMLLFLLIDPELAYTGVDPLFMSEGNRISYFFVNEDGDEVAFEYPYTRLGETPLAYHEIGHGVVGSSEQFAEDFAYAVLQRARYRWQTGDFRADLVVVDADGTPVPPPAP